MSVRQALPIFNYIYKIFKTKKINNQLSDFNKDNKLPLSFEVRLRLAEVDAKAMNKLTLLLPVGDGSFDMKPG